LLKEIYITASCVISNQVIYKNEQPVFEDKETDLSALLVAAYRHFAIAYPKFFKMDTLSKMGFLAAELLLKDNWDPEKYPPEQVAVVLANASSSLETDIKYFDTTKDIASPALFVYTLPNIVMGEICIRHHFKGENAFFIFAEFDTGFFEQYVRLLFNNNILQACICGWVEMSGDQYKTVLFLVETDTSNSSILFTKENINKTYQLYNG